MGIIMEMLEDHRNMYGILYISYKVPHPNPTHATGATAVPTAAAAAAAPPYSAADDDSLFSDNPP